MKGVRGPLLGAGLALCLHGPLVAAGMYRYSWDAATHMFFADHYRRSWFALWEPRWFGGFSVSSYPPLVHQLLALLSVPFGYDAAFAILLLMTLVVFPIAAWRFAQVFVPPGAANNAAVLAAVLPGIALAAHAFGQLPTLVGLTAALFLVFAFTRFVEDGGVTRLGLCAGLAATTFAAHHATGLFFVPPALLAGVSAVVIGADRSALRLRLRRAALAAVICGSAGGLVVLPFWLWASAGIHQAFIPHNSRSNFLQDFGAQALYLWAIDGLLPALAVFGLWIRTDRRAVALAVFGGLMVVAGLGGTTPLPALLFGRQWQWLTYDRFALWGAVSILPLAAISLRALLSARDTTARLLVVAAVAGLLIYAGGDAVISVAGPSLPYQRDLTPIAQFMNAGRTHWRYQTFGVGDTAAALGTMTPAATIDGTYYSARHVPELAGSGIGTLDAALWWDPSGAVLRRALARANAYSIRWAFVMDPRYDPYLRDAGFAPRPPTRGDIEVWENAFAPPVASDVLSFGAPDIPGILWGSLPITSLLLTLGLALALRRAGNQFERQTGRPRIAAPLAAEPAGSR